jgi:hypothetical protein
MRIEGDSIFSMGSYVEQAPVEIQLAVSLYHFGHNGNTASIEGIAQWAGLSMGMIVKCM